LIRANRRTALALQLCGIGLSSFVGSHRGPRSVPAILCERGRRCFTPPHPRIVATRYLIRQPSTALLGSGLDCGFLRRRHPATHPQRRESELFQYRFM
jgi:hypothetical protein